MNTKIDSNITGLRYCEEASLATLPAAASQRWVELEPNSYPDFGGEITTVARNPINPGRQRKKGTVTNIEADGGFNTDLTQTNMQDMLQGFLFADFRSKQEFTGAAQTVTNANNRYAATGIHTGYFVGDLIFATNYTGSNNGLKRITAVATDQVDVAETLQDETSGTTAKLVCVGFQFDAGDAEIDASGDLPQLVTTTKNLTQLGLNPGEWIFIGGDTTGTQFAQMANNGWVRVRSVSANAIVLDKASATMVTDDGDTKTIRLFKGRVLKNEVGTLIKRRSYTLERTLGVSDPAEPTKEQAEYLEGAIPDGFTLNATAADKLTADLSFVATNNFVIDENDDGDPDLLSKVTDVVRVAVEEADAFNTSSDFNRIRLSIVSDTDENPDPLFTYSEEISLEITNNNSPNNALGVLGAFEVTAGDFLVGGSITAYFGSVAAVSAVRNNSDITLDIIMVKSNSGIAIDVPLLTLGGGRLNVEKDQPIKIPLENMACTGAKIDANLNHTLMMVFFDYLPDLAS